MSFANIVFKIRSYTPIPFLIAAILYAELNPVYIAVGLLLGICGEWLRLWSNSHAGGATRTRNVGAPSLITSGPYGYIRNPLYLANMMIYTGFSLGSGAIFPWLPIITFLFFTIQYALIISLEELKLNELFSAEYKEYCKHVPRLFPGFHQRYGEVKNGRPFSEALKLEKRSLQSLILVWILLILRLYFL
ncbi:isoprenylcysteine carboxylmethyltransferase family protein [bacterium]|nr:isoprenylcysteine carboxylmethyltransferase family protein [bacterium]